MGEQQEQQEQQVKLNLYQKLVEVRKGAIYLQKTAKGMYAYTPGSSFIAALRGAMDKQNLLLVPNMESFELVEVGAGKALSAKIELSFTWIDADEPSSTLTTRFTYLDKSKGGDCQGVGSVLTYSERYFLCKFFQIATDGDDPDAFVKKHGLDTDEAGDEDEEGREAPPPVPLPFQDISISEAVAAVGQDCQIQNWGQLKEYIEEMKRKSNKSLSACVSSILKRSNEFKSAYNIWLVTNRKN